MVAMSTEYENFLKAILHNNISYLLELVWKTNPDVFQQFFKDSVAVEVNNLCKLTINPYSGTAIIHVNIWMYLYIMHI